MRENKPLSTNMILDNAPRSVSVEMTHSLQNAEPAS